MTTKRHTNPQLTVADRSSQRKHLTAPSRIALPGSVDPECASRGTLPAQWRSRRLPPMTSRATRGQATYACTHVAVHRHEKSRYNPSKTGKLKPSSMDVLSTDQQEIANQNAGRGWGPRSYRNPAFHAIIEHNSVPADTSISCTLKWRDAERVTRLRIGCGMLTVYMRTSRQEARPSAYEDT